jgi:hypothetical protein
MIGDQSFMLKVTTGAREGGVDDIEKNDSEAAQKWTRPE